MSSSPLPQNKNKPLETIFTLIGILFVSISAISNVGGSGNKKHSETIKPKVVVRRDTKTAKAGDVSDYATIDKYSF